MSGPVRPFKGVAPAIGENVFIAPNATVIGDVEIGRDSSIWYNCLLRGDVHQIRVGERTNIQDGTIVHVTSGKHGTYIGSDITIGHSAVIHGATLEDGAFIGMRATVLDGAVVEGGAMVAAGAVVGPGKRVKRGELWAGVPAKCIRELNEDAINDLGHTAAHYVELARAYLEE